MDDHFNKGDYEYYFKVWTKLNVKTLGYYSYFYNALDIVLVSDVFEKIINVCLDTYKLDPAYCLTTSGVAWDAKLCN